MNRENKLTNRSGIPRFDEGRPEWQKDRGKRYGNRRKEVAYLKWKERKKDRRERKFVDSDQDQ